MLKAFYVFLLMPNKAAVSGTKPKTIRNGTHHKYH